MTTTRMPSPPSGGTWRWDPERQQMVPVADAPAPTPEPEPAGEDKTIPFRRRKQPASGTANTTED